MLGAVQNDTQPFLLMKNLICLGFVFSALSALGQLMPIKADVYEWRNAAVSKKNKIEQRQILEGTTPAFKYMKIHAETLQPKQGSKSHQHTQEELMIVKEGELTMTLNGKTETLEAGSIALIMPGDVHGFENKSGESVTYYIMNYESVEPVDLERGAKAGGSLVVHWNQVAFKTHDKGGRRNFFDRATAHSKRFEMHVTTLNEGLMSHPPHTHQAAEILLLTDKQAQESINGEWIKADVGDIIFLQSNVPHAIQNISKGACTYFAFQFE